MTYIDKYLNSIKSISGLSDNVLNTANKISAVITDTFDYKSNLTGLLLGNVQSGKTAHSLGIISKLADSSFDIFLLLTTDNIILQEQTYQRAKKSLSFFDVFSERDDIPFQQSRLKKPVVVVLKKNSSVLKKWRGFLSSSGYCLGRSLVVIDDEADAASLNTLVNKSKQSTINKHLTAVRDLFTSAIYIQVTATPQSVLLQSKLSGFKPQFVHFFESGINYIGGNFIYSSPKSFCTVITGEFELDDVKSGTDFIPEGLKKSLLTYLITCADFYSRNKENCNFLIHPSVRMQDHDSFASIIGECLNLLITPIRDGADTSEIEEIFKDSWVDLQKTAPNILNFEDIVKNITKILDEELIKIRIINSHSSKENLLDKGYNIIIGGNSLGRGVTIPSLQTVYYCRRSKSPQADTYWQHCRIFGYDREQGLIRVFIPESLLDLFTDLNSANNILINQILADGLDKIQLIYPSNIRPTRKNVVDNKILNLIVGNVNYFPRHPIQDKIKTSRIDLLTATMDESIPYEETDIQTLLEIMDFLGNEKINEWNINKFIGCVKALQQKRPHIKCKLIIRRNRDIGKGTGTLLSPTDRTLGDSWIDSIVLTLYRVVGQKEKGWSGEPFWIPNIKFPSDSCFYDTIE